MSPHWRWGSTENGQIEFESLTTETMEGALDVIRNSFCVNENVCIGLELISEPGAPEELLELCMEVAKDGVSTVAIDISTKKVVGVAFNKIQVDTAGENFFEQFSDNCKCKSSKVLIEFMVDVDKRFDLFENYNTNCILELMFLAVLPEYGQRRIGELLVSSVLQLGTKLQQGSDVRIPVMIRGNNEVTNANMVPSLVSAIMTSEYTQKISIKLGFKELLKISYEEFEFKGKKFSEKIPSPHTHCVLVAKTLKPM